MVGVYEVRERHLQRYSNWDYSNITLVNCRRPEHYLYPESACVAGIILLLTLPQPLVYHSGAARLAAELKAGTIDRTMEKSDFQLGVGILTGTINPPWNE